MTDKPRDRIFGPGEMDQFRAAARDHDTRVLFDGRTVVVTAVFRTIVDPRVLSERVRRAAAGPLLRMVTGHTIRRSTDLAIVAKSFVNTDEGVEDIAKRVAAISPRAGSRRGRPGGREGRREAVGHAPSDYRRRGLMAQKQQDCPETATDIDGTVVPCAFEAGHAEGHRFIRIDPPIHMCGFCGELFEISASDPHWSTGRGPLCPNRKQPEAAATAPTAGDLAPTEHDHVVGDVARCRKHNTIRRHVDEPCWQCWNAKDDART